jgi:hypothetical protein
MSDQPYQNTLHFLNAHIDMLNHSSVQHPCRHIPPPSFPLQVIETLEDDAFTMSETVSNIWERVTRVMAMHRSMLFALVSLMYLQVESLQLLHNTF